MKYGIVFLTIGLMALSNCTHVVIRKGYSIKNFDKNNNDCDVTFLKNASVDTTKCSVLGKVKIGDSGFSFACGEDDAIERLRREACNMNANVVNIIEEKRPDFLSSCYRVTALLLRQKNDTAGQGEVLGNYHYNVDTASVETRVKEDQQRNTTIIISAILAGLVVGLLLALLPHP